TVDADTGKVTVGHEAVKAEGTVEAQARSGNSDLSGTGSVGMPAIATTPSAPVPAVVDTADHVGIEIPAPEHADKVVVTFDKADGSGKDTVTVKKNDQGKWSADKTVAGLTVDADTGKVTVGHEAVKAEGTGEAQARSGNSDL
ncbi:hypothetical protein, partial [Streptococcus pneumoniae]|uniref:hypothetical protein n=1 Tax=Streptococcus pneumoniae TaxID=1313 RepID=UPI0018B07A8B